PSSRGSICISPSAAATSPTATGATPTCARLNDPEIRRQFFRDDIHGPLCRVDGGTSPIGPAVVAGQFDRALHAGWRKQTLVARVAQPLARGLLLLRSQERIDVLFRKGLARERTRPRWKGLCE